MKFYLKFLLGFSKLGRERTKILKEIYVKEIKKFFGDLQVLEDISMDFAKGSITCILGPSGCGKSTLLNIISGIIKDYEGQIEGFNDKPLSFIFQEDRLIPWLTVYDNMKFVLKERFKGAELSKVIKKYISMVGMEDYLNFYPETLSGGMKQRVSIARAFAYGGKIMIMDEPFKALDLKNKLQLIKDFKKLCIDNEVTVIFVTHDIDEAIELGDYIYVLSEKPAYIKRKIENTRDKSIRELLLKDIIE